MDLNLMAPQNPKNMEKVLNDINASRDTLHANSKKLFQLRDESFQKRRLIAQKKKELGTAHDRIKNVIAEETDQRGKAKFSNEIKRQAEFIERVANDASCREFEAQLDTLMMSSAELDNKIEDVSFDQEVLLLDYKLGLQLLKVFGKHLGV